MAKRVALVEDDRAIRDNIADALKKYGYEVSMYTQREEAMNAFRTRLPDLALIDIGLGHEVDGGYTLCRELRGMSEQLPIIFLSARDSDFEAAVDVAARILIGASGIRPKAAFQFDMTYVNHTARMFAQHVVVAEFASRTGRNAITGDREATVRAIVRSSAAA